MTRKTEVLVLGAGVIGLSCAYFLAKAGREVTILDQSWPGSGASHGNCGTITPSHAPPLAKPGMVAQALAWMARQDSPFYIRPRFDPVLWRWLWRFARRCNWRDFEQALAGKARLLLQSRRLLAELIRAEAIDCEYAERGHLTVFRDPAALAAFDWWPRALRSVGMQVNALDGAALRAREPCLRAEVVGGFDTPLDAEFKPDAYVGGLTQVVAALGVSFASQAEVQGFRVDGQRVAAVHTRAGEFAGEQLVLALGAWSPLLARQLGLELPVQPGKGYSITGPRPRRCPGVPIVCRERSVAITPWRERYRVGSTMEFSGYDTRLDRTRLDALLRGAAEYVEVEDWGEATVEEWFGWRPMTFDDLPIIGAAPGHSNLWLATGHGMLGMSMSAATGLLVADLVCGRPPQLDPEPYAPTRFHAGRNR
ncbi:MAG: FAD-dependent oxidoreductase [Xanthomonadales bacterium]|nr:D-amino acid dehydrogenase 1 [Xanthomonadales bacterium]MCC6594809.1 FAD-dependent oxidoreductase [Xanthomonadales bacterium]MCE7929983.1 FAD-dependent oxidoreductase [Xanthomonadales bacterium PRO6]